MADDRLEQRREIAFSNAVVAAGIARTAARVECWEVELLVAGVEVEEQLEYLVENFGGPSVRPIDLVDDDDRAKAKRQRLSSDELGLRHRTFGSVDEQDHSIHHRQDSLDLGPEIGVTGRVDDVDPGPVPLNRGALGKNRDPTLLLEVVGIHRALLDTLILAECTRLAKELVDKRRLAVIDVRDDRDVAQIHFDFPGKIRWRM
jgi:hypothetical protein